MVPSSLHDAQPLIWPKLDRPSDGQKLVYLDQKDWIHLAQADTGHSEGHRYAAALQAAHAAKAAGTAVFPLSLTHYSETLKITDPKQRGDLARVMEQLSGFTTLPPRSLTALYELDAALRPAAGIESSILPPVDLLGHGFRWAHAFPVVGHVVGPDGEDATDQLVQNLGRGGMVALMATFELIIERMMLTGPSDEELPQLQALGYDPDAIVQAARDRADNEAEFSANLPDTVRRRPTALLDRVVGRELLAPDIMPAWRRLVTAYGQQVFDALPAHEPATTRTLARSMPGFEVTIALKAARHRDANRKWTSNDMFDIDALAVAVPYCDVVGADSAQAHALTVTGLAARMGTTLMSSVADLPSHL